MVEYFPGFEALIEEMPPEKWQPHARAAIEHYMTTGEIIEGFPFSPGPVDPVTGSIVGSQEWIEAQPKPIQEGKEMVYYPSEIGAQTTRQGQVIYDRGMPVADPNAGMPILPWVESIGGYTAETLGIEDVPIIGPLVTGVTGALGSLPGWLTAALGVAGAGYAAYQALGGGEGEGLFGLDILGGGNGGGGGGRQMMVDGVPLTGPFAPEPPKWMTLKEWRLNLGGNVCNFYLVKTSRGHKVVMRNGRTGAYKAWPLPRPAVIGKNMPSHKMLTRLRRNLKKHSADAKTIIQVASPTTYARWQGYKKPKRRR